MPQKKHAPFKHLTLAQEVKRLKRLEREGFFEEISKKDAPAVPLRTHPLPYPFNSIAGWKKIDERLHGWKEDSEKGKFRYHAIIWIWYETLRRLSLSIDQRISFARDLHFLSEDAHDAFLGSQERTPMACAMPDLLPDLKLAYAVQEGYLTTSGESNPAILSLLIDTRYPSTVLKRLVSLRIDEAKERADSIEASRNFSQKGKSHSLARLVDVLHVVDEKESQGVKWSAAASMSKTFHQHDLTVRGDKVSALYSAMAKAARQGLKPFFSAFF